MSMVCRVILFVVCTALPNSAQASPWWRALSSRTRQTQLPSSFGPWFTPTSVQGKAPRGRMEPSPGPIPAKTKHIQMMRVVDIIESAHGKRGLEVGKPPASETRGHGVARGTDSKVKWREAKWGSRDLSASARLFMKWHPKTAKSKFRKVLDNTQYSIATTLPEGSLIEVNGQRLMTTHRIRSKRVTESQLPTRALLWCRQELREPNARGGQTTAVGVKSCWVSYSELQ